MDFTLHQLRCFLAVVDALHFSRAAESMRLSPSTMSEQIATLERQFGRRLFDRSSRNVVLTSHGAQLEPLARSVVAAAAGVASWARDEPEAVLNVGVTAASPGIRSILVAAAHELPGVRWQVRSVGFRDGIPAVISGEVDCAFVFGLPDEAQPGGVRAIPLWRETLLVAIPAAHRLAARKSIAVEDLWGETLIAPSGGAEGGAGARDDWYSAIDPALVERCRIAPLVSSVDETMELVAAGIGLNIAGASAATSYAREGISFVPLDTELRVQALLVVRDEPPVRALTSFLQLARATAAVDR